MRTMIDLGRTTIMDTPIAVDCSPTIPYRRSSFRSLIQCMAPCFFSPSTSFDYHHPTSASAPSSSSSSSSSSASPSPPHNHSLVTGTFFGHRRGRRVSLCIQHGNRTLLFLQLSVPTSSLAKEMQSGILRITLECSESRLPEEDSSPGLYDVPVWRMYWNGRKVGYAVRRRRPAKEGYEEEVLRVMRKVSVGAGVVRLEGGGADEEDEVMYMRARFERVVGSVDAEAFHMISPVGCVGQELSVFLLRS